MSTANARKGYELHRAVVQSADSATGITQVKIPDLLGNQVVEVHWAGLEKVGGVYKTPNPGDMSLVAVSNDGTQIMWVLSADHSALWGTATTHPDSFGTIAVSGQSDVVADTDADTLTLAAGSGIALTTDAATDTVTIASTVSVPNNFGTVAVAGQSNVVADSTSDTLTLAAGAGMAITTDAATDTVTVAASSSNFGTIAVSGQSDVVADALSDTLTLAAGSGIALTTTPVTDTVTVANSGVLSLTGTASEVEVSASTGAITVGLPSSVTVPTLTVSTNLNAVGTLQRDGTNSMTMISSGVSPITVAATALTTSYADLTGGTTGALSLVTGDVVFLWATFSWHQQTAGIIGAGRIVRGTSIALDTNEAVYRGMNISDRGQTTTMNRFVVPSTGSYTFRLQALNGAASAVDLDASHTRLMWQVFR